MRHTGRAYSGWARSKRRGVSEIVGTLLMIAIVVSLGVVVFTFASGSLSSLSSGFTGLISGQGNTVSEKYVVEQAAFSAPPSIDGLSTGSFSTALSGTVTLTTANPDDVIVVFVSNEDTTGSAPKTVGSVTASGLAFSKRSSASISSAPYSDAEVWYAVATTQETSLVITVTISGVTATDDASIVAFGVSGANTAAPWDGHAFESATSTSGATAPSVSSVTTSNSPDLILGFSGILDASTHTPPTETPSSAYTLVGTQNNNGGTGKSEAAVEDEGVSSTQSSITVAFGTAVVTQNNWITIADGIVGNTGANVYVRNVGTVASTLVSVYAVDQTTGAFIGQFPISASLPVQAVVEISESIVDGFTPAHGQTYSFTVTSSLGNSVIYYAKYN